VAILLIEMPLMVLTPLGALARLQLSAIGAATTATTIVTPRG
jgi:hypothetical protein